MRGANPGNVWEFSHMHYCNKNRTKHPTQKPEGLYERMILASSDEGDVVLDPCLLYTSIVASSDGSAITWSADPCNDYTSGDGETAGQSEGEKGFTCLLYTSRCV